MKLTKDDFLGGDYTRQGGAMRYGLLYKEIAQDIQNVGDGHLIEVADITDRYNTTTKKLKGAIWSAICGKQKVQIFKDIDPDIQAQVYSSKQGIVIRRI